MSSLRVLIPALAAPALGLAYLFLAGAPATFQMGQAATFAVGLVVLLPLGRRDPARWQPILLTGVAILATALFGHTVEGATRWVRLGPLSLQPALVLLPAAIVAFARAPSRPAAFGLSIAALALAVQPDRGTAGMLAAGLAMLAARHPSRLAAIPLAAALLAFAVTLIRPDAVAPAPFVEGVLTTAVATCPIAGLAAVAGALLLLAPATVGRTPHLVFGAVWAAGLAAAAFGPYPTPVVGYGPSALFGYLLSVAVLRRI